MEELKKEMTTNKAQDALNKLSQGEETINQIRDEFGLKPIQDEFCNKPFINTTRE